MTECAFKERRIRLQDGRTIKVDYVSLLTNLSSVVHALWKEQQKTKQELEHLRKEALNLHDESISAHQETRGEIFEALNGVGELIRRQSLMLSQLAHHITGVSVKTEKIEERLFKLENEEQERHHHEMLDLIRSATSRLKKRSSPLQPIFETIEQVQKLREKEVNIADQVRMRIVNAGRVLKGLAPFEISEDEQDDPC